MRGSGGEGETPHLPAPAARAPSSPCGRGDFALNGSWLEILGDELGHF
jgi:hypothetical protein